MTASVPLRWLALAALAGVVGIITAAPRAQAPGGGSSDGASTAQGERPQAPSFRAGVEVVSLSVTVADGEQRYVTDLEAKNFQVFEDGALQEITFFTRANLPIALSLLLDTSASMEARLETAQEAAIGFARSLRKQDLAEVVDFDSRAVILQTFTNESADLEQAIRRTSAGGSTSLYNAVYIALKDLKRIVATSTDEIRRQAIVVLSDGEDTSSLLSFEEVLDLAKRSETAIYAIGLRTEQGSGNRGFREAEFVLRQLTQETGGRVFFPTRIEELPAIYTQIADELSSQYTLGYTSRNTKRDGAWRRTVVRVDRPSVTARSKQGYYAPTAR
jgi:Ca-activated chloride channel family protein